MKFAESELKQITAETWRILLGEELEPQGDAALPAQMDEPVAAGAQIAGDWQLATLLYCPVALARHAAEVMFGVAKDGASTDDVQDVLCELINIISGNIKGVLSGSNRLSLPHIINGSDIHLRFPRHVLLSEACFVSDGLPLVVRLLGEDRLSTRLGQRSSTSAGGAN